MELSDIIDINVLHEQMLEQISDDYQKTVGLPAYDFTRAFAVAVMSLRTDINIAMEHLNVENLTGEDLDTWVQQRRGLDRKYATFAEAELTILSGAGEIQAGDLFSTVSGVDFQATSDGVYKTGDTFMVRAYEGGSSGNVGAGEIKKMPITISGIGSVTNKLPASGGYDAESDEEYRERYYSSLRNPDNGSNQQAFKNWAYDIAGVGRVKVFPQAQGLNSVEVCVTGGDYGAASEDVVRRVQESIDPGKNGDGSGRAPIGAVCLVTSAVVRPIKVTANIVLSPGYNLSKVTESVKTAIKEYLSSIAFIQDFVSYGKIGNAINDAEGVADYSGLILNDDVRNVSLGERETPILGTVVLK